MANPAASVFERVRKPEYTGENRCIPCTIVNVAIAIVVSGVATIVAFELAVVVFALSLLLVYLRGYLVPGTPTLTKRYLPDRVLALFDKHPENARSTAETPTFETLEKLEYERANAVDPRRFLFDVGAVEVEANDASDDVVDGDSVGADAVEEDEYSLTDEFEVLVGRWIETYRDDAVDRDAIAAMFETEPDAITRRDRDYPAIEIDSRIRRWPGESALLADVAAHHALEELTDRWLEVPLEQRLEILESLRTFHDACPRCSGEIALDTETGESCCRTYEVVTLGCEACGDRLREYDPTLIATHGDGRGVLP